MLRRRVALSQGRINRPVQSPRPAVLPHGNKYTQSHKISNPGKTRYFPDSCAEPDYIAATYLGQQMKLRILSERRLVISQRFFGIPPFRFYALADGI
jgi:hypothetical protein